LEKLCVAVPNYDIKTVLVDISTNVRQESYLVLHVEDTALTTKQMTMKNKF